jgi:ferredoxin
MRIVVNRKLCESFGMCVGVAPNVFRLDDDDILVILDEDPPVESRPKIEEAVRLCPKQALSIEND